MTTRKERTKKFSNMVSKGWTKHFWNFIQNLYEDVDEDDNDNEGYFYPDPDMTCNYLLLSVNTNLSWELIKNNQHLDWYIGHISKNFCITWK